MQWSTINKGASVDDSFTMLHVIVMLLLDAVIYGLITWYVEAVWPGEFGIPQPWYFPVLVWMKLCLITTPCRHITYTVHGNNVDTRHGNIEIML